MHCEWNSKEVKNALKARKQKEKKKSRPLVTCCNYKNKYVALMKEHVDLKRKYAQQESQEPPAYSNGLQQINVPPPTQHMNNYVGMKASAPTL